MISLEECLNNLTVPELKSRLDLIKSNPTPNRKAEIISFLCQELLSKRFEIYWHRLNDIEQLAIAETIYHWNGIFNHNRFLAKYGRLPGFFSSKRNNIAKQSPLLLFFYKGSIPDELANICEDYVQAPLGYQLKNISDEDIQSRVASLQLEHKSLNIEYQAQLSILSMETTAIHDLQAMLNLIETGKLSVSEKTNLAGAASLKKITAVLLDGDYYSDNDDWGLQSQEGGAIASIRAFAWPLLLQSSGLVKRIGTKLQLTAKGKKVSTGPIEESIRLLYQRWRDKGKFDEFKRIDVIKGQSGKGRRMANVFDRRIAIEDALMACPENQWIAIDDFFRFVLAENFEFQVIYDFWRLYIFDSNYGSLGYGDCSFEAIQGRYIMVYLFEYLATLGMIDVAYVPPYHVRKDYQQMQETYGLVFFSRYDGLLYFRLNSLGSYCLERTEEYQPPKQNSSALLSIGDALDLSLQRTPTPSEQLILDQYLVPETHNTYQLDQGYLLQAVEQGGNLSSFVKFLEDAIDQPLSKTMMDVIAELEERCNALSDVGNARLINCSSVALAKMLAADPNTGKYCFYGLGKLLVIPEKSVKAFQKASKKLGYIMPKKSL